MKPRIGLIARHDLLNEFSSVRQDKSFDLVCHRFERHEIDGILYIPSDDQIEHRLLETLESDSFQDGPQPVIASIGTSVESKNLPHKVITVPGIQALVNLVKIRQREQASLEEANRRASITSQFQQTIPRFGKPAPKTKERILFLGEPSPFFMRCVRELNSPTRKFEAALTERTGYDFLKHTHPAAILIKFSKTFQPIELLEYIQERSDLKSVPVVAITEQNSAIPDLEHLVSAVMFLGENDARNVSELLTTLGRQTHRHPMSPKELGPQVTDRYSGAFTADFAEKHIQALARSDTPMAYAVVNPFGTATGSDLETARLAQFVKSISGALRREDLIARLDWHSFLITLHNVEEKEAHRTLNRLQSIVELTSHGSNKPTLSFSYKLVCSLDHADTNKIWNHVVTLTKAQRSQASAVA